MTTLGSAGNPDFPWKELIPNEHGDWISQRADVFQTFTPLGDKEDKVNRNVFFVPMYSNGVKTNRDSWVYNFSRLTVEQNASSTIDFYNNQRTAYQNELQNTTAIVVEDFIDTNPTKISWSRALRTDIARNKEYEFYPDCMTNAMYRPFCKQWMYFHRHIINDVALIPKLFPAGEKNRVICVSGVGVTKDFSAVMTDTLPDLELIGKSQCFPLHYYKEPEGKTKPLFGDEPKREKRDGVSDYALEEAQRRYGKNVEKEDVLSTIQKS